MKISHGSLCFIKNEFYEKVRDPFLKINYEETKRPHYYAYFDNKTGLYWMVPCSSRIEKYELLIKKKKEHGKPTDAIKIIKIFDKKTVLLFQDMFPILEKYIEGPYIKGGQYVCISDPKLIQQMERTAKKIIGLLRNGVRFTPTQPDIKHIEQCMVEEKSRSIAHSHRATKR